MKNSIWAVVLLALTMGSCGEETPEITSYESGVIVVNQGAFQTGSGTLTYKERGSSTVVQNIFSLSNDGAFLGNIAQSMIEHGGKNYISINNGGKVVVTDKNEFTIVDTIGSIYQSRYFASDGEDLFVSAWGESGSSGNIRKLNSELDKIESAVLFANGAPEGIILIDNHLYVAKGGGFGLDSVLVIYEKEDFGLVKSITVGDQPELIVKDNDNNVYVICNGYSDFLDPSNNTSGRLVKISNQEIIWSYEIPNGSNRLAIDTDNGFLYFNMNGNVVKQNINSDSLSTTIVREGTTAYALGFDVFDEKLYIGDAKDFSSQGEVYVYSTDDVELESFKCGIIPSYFHFK
jgi:hypothetical protein